jgi:hypothetical protein
VARNLRLLIFLPVAVLAVFGNVAQAEDVQWQVTQGSVDTSNGFRFSYMTGVVQTQIAAPAGSIVTLIAQVDNTTTNSIGYGTPKPDTWQISLAGETVDAVSGSSAGIFEVGLSVVSAGVVTATISGKDEGFWAGFYGPFVFNVNVAVDPGETTTTTSSTTTTEVATTTTTTLQPSTTQLTSSTSEPATAPTSTTLIEETSPEPTQPSTTSTQPAQTSIAPPNLTTSSVAISTTTTTVAPPVVIPPESSTSTTWLVPLPSSIAITTLLPTSVPSTTSAPTTTLPPTTTAAPTTTQATTTSEAATTSQPTESTIGTKTAPTTAIATTVPATTPDTTQPTPAIPTDDNATEFFADLKPDDLTQAEADQLVQIVQNASDDVRQEFEATIDLYSGKFDDYVPIGSTVPVRTRRVIIAVATATMMPVARRRSI